MKFYACLIAFLITTGCRTDPKTEPNQADTYGFTDSNTDSTSVLICRGTSSYAYHHHHCKGLKRCRALIETVTLSNAQAMGRTPCGYCYSDDPPATRQQFQNRPAQGQCTATTKKGTRCSRKAKSNGLCWQHGR
jgi:hypothetical protein